MTANLFRDLKPLEEAHVSLAPEIFETTKVPSNTYPMKVVI
jgi:hypothetical protein